MTANATTGIYIHIPFCKKKCPYCSFFSSTDLEKKEKFLFFLKKEMALVSATDLPVANTIYIGGGTPSVYEPSHISEILNSLYKNFKISDNPEITMEINPGTITSNKLSGYKKAGINRISIGVQSFCNKDLAFLGRIHTSKQAKKTIFHTRDAGIENISIDLIYAIAGQSHEEWLSSLKTAINFSPEHISCYMLTYEPNTPLNLWREKGFFKPLNDKIQSKMFQTTATFLRSAGYFHYEISNFAKSKNSISKHNTKYWAHTPYIGFGPSAHSYNNCLRWYNHCNLTKYFSDLNKNILPIRKTEKIGRQERFTETILLGLRTDRGIDIKNFNACFKINFNKHFEETISYLKKKGYIKPCNDFCALTSKGMLFSDSIINIFVHTGI